MSFLCNTCRISYTTFEEVKDHYRTDLHVFNNKRRSKNLKPITDAEFNKLSAVSNNHHAVEPISISPILSSSDPIHYKVVVTKPPLPPSVSAATNALKENNYSLQRTYNNSDRQRQEMINSMTKSSSSLTSSKSNTIMSNEVDEINNSFHTSVSLSTNNNNNNNNNNNEANLNDEDNNNDDDIKNCVDNEVEDEEEQSKHTPQPSPPIGANISIFDNKVFDTMENCLQAMVLNNGFFIPDAEYISDLEGLLLYCSEKVKLGGICLYCQKRFRSGWACQHHMTQKSHCKLAYDEDKDLEEFEDFYDFSSTFEDCEDDEEDENLDAQISPVTGEMILPDGRTLGHRDFRVYYKQHYKVEDSRPSVMAQKREELLKVSSKYNDKEHSLEVIEHMNDFQIQSALIKHYKLTRKANILEQRGMMKRMAHDQQREYKSKIQAARSSATTTAKIRDYHSIIM